MGKIFYHLLGMSLTAAYCIGAVIVLRLLLKRQAKLFSYLLWSVVLFRLLCPVSFAGNYSLVRIDPAVVEEKIIYDGQKTVWQGKGYLPDENGEADQNSRAVESAATSPIEKWQSIETVQRVLAVCEGIWLVGVAALLGYSVWTAGRLKRFLLAARPAAEEADAGAAENVCEMDGIAAPFVFGLIRPRIYLPAHLQPEERRYVLAHERVHIARKDYLVKLLYWGAVCLHWFNPFVWLSFKLMESDMEMSCDETVIKRLGMEVKEDYSRALLSLSCKEADFHPGPVAFCEGGIKSRIRNILSYKKSRIATAAVLAALLCAVAAGLALNPADGDGKQEELTAEKLSFLNAYANAYCSRNGDEIMDMYADEETAYQSLPFLEKVGKTYTFGLSSPWPNEFRCVLTEELGAGREGENSAEIWYYAWTSDPHVVVWKEKLRFEWIESGGKENYRVVSSVLRYLDSISSKEEFDEAYLIAGSYSFTDYEERGFLEGIQAQTGYDKENGGEDRNAVYRSPDTAAERILNLTGGSAKISSTDSDGHASVIYTFADGSDVLIPMYNAAYRSTTETSGDADGEGGPTDDVWFFDTSAIIIH